MGDIRVLVNGALGKMGRAISAGLEREQGMTIVGAVDIEPSGSRFLVPDVDAPLGTSIEEVADLTSPAVLVDFSHASATVSAVEAVASRGMGFVVGTTGLPDEAVASLEVLSKSYNVGGVVAPNFSIGAVLMMHLAQQAASYFDHVEITETHHDTKVDAPSGTAVATARMLSAVRGKAFERNIPERESVADTRSGQIDGVTIHSLRLPGAMAHQDVIFGIAGQTLTIRHDTINRDCYVPGIARAVRHVVSNKGFVFGLDKLLGL